MTQDPERNRLSPREEAVLRHAAEGMTDQQIANTLDIRVSTVTTYWIRIRGKLGRLSRSELVAMWVRQHSQDTVDALRHEVASLRKQLQEQEARTEAAVRDLELALTDLRGREHAGKR